MRKNPTQRWIVCRSFLSAFALCLGAGAAQAEIAFDDVTAQSGINFTGRSFGASWGDFNGDGWPDLWTGNHRVYGSIFLNNQDGTFSNVIAGLWSNPIAPDGHGAAWGDFDNDGDQDLVQLSGGGAGSGSSPNLLLINNVTSITEQAAARGIQYADGRGRTPLWLDWDSDGDLDLVATNLKRGDGKAPTNLFLQNGGNFTQTSQLATADPNSHLFGQISDVLVNGTPMLILANQWGYPTGMYNFGQGSFTNQKPIIGFPNTAHVRDVAIEDFDGDLRPDFFLARMEAGIPDAEIDTDNNVRTYFQLSRNELGVTFKTSGTVTFEFGPDWEVPPSNIFIGSGGYNPGGRTFSLSPANAANQGIKPHTPGSSFGFYIGYDPATQVWTVRASKSGYMSANMMASSTTPISNLVKNLGNGSVTKWDRLILNTGAGFVDHTNAAGFNVFTSCDSVAAGDMDNDMDVDLYVVCTGQTSNLPNRLYENTGGAVFQPVPGAGGAEGSVLGRGETVAMADYDNDGFLDLFVTNGQGEPPFTEGPYELFRNQGNDNNWIEIELEGIASNKDGVGAKVIATAGGTVQMREQNGGVHKVAQNHQRIHFGLADNDLVDLTIKWPSGAEDTYTGVLAKGIYKAVEGSSELIEIIGSGPTEPTVFISGASVNEDAGTASFALTLAPTADQAVAVDFTTVDDTATEGQDYYSASGQVVFAAGESSQTIEVDIIDDTAQENVETFNVELTGVSNAVLSSASAVGTILDNDGVPCGAPGYNTSADRAVFLWKDCTTGNWVTRFTAAGGYIEYSGSVTADQLLETYIPFSLEGADFVDTSNPTGLDFNLYVSPPYIDGIEFAYPDGASICFELEIPGPGTVLVGPDRSPVTGPFNPETLGPCAAPAPALLINDVTVPEDAGTATFNVSLTSAATAPVTVNYGFSDDSAQNGLDYNATGGTLLFNPGDLTRPIDVLIVDDGDEEGQERFVVTLSNALGADISVGSAFGNITDNDSSVACGAPAYDPAVDRAMVMWKDCATGFWVVRFAGGSGGWIRYQGTMNSPDGFADELGYSLEPSDTFDFTSSSTQIYFRTEQVTPWDDGFSFSTPNDANVCIDVTTPATPTILVGPSRTPVPDRFNLATLEGC